MTISPPGAQLAPVDLPPPPPSADPREPSPTSSKIRPARTPQRPRSPMPNSRGTSPERSYSHPHPSTSPHHVGTGAGGGGVPQSPLERVPDPPGGLAQPVPTRATGPGGSASPLSGSSPTSIGNNPLTPPHPSQSFSSGGAGVGGIHGYSHGPTHPHLSRPSSPSSIHSSTSAIFERDIELPAVASLSLNPNATPTAHTLNHKSSRLSHLSHGSALDHSVPAVLDDAVEALHHGDQETPGGGVQSLEIEAPAAAGGIGMARQSSASLQSVPRKASTTPGQSGIFAGAGAGAGGVILNSRSPSPTSMHSGTSSIISPAQSPPILSKLSTGAAAQRNVAATGTGGADNVSLISGGSGGSGGLMRPSIGGRMSTGPQLPGGWTSDPKETDEEGVEPANGAKPEDLTSAAAAEAATASVASSPSPPPPGIGQGMPPLPLGTHMSNNPNKDKRRISFISYNDLLLSVPTTVTPLADITSGNLSPDHLPGTVSPSVSSARSPILPPNPAPVYGGPNPVSLAGGGGQGTGAGAGAMGGTASGSGIGQAQQTPVPGVSGGTATGSGQTPSMASGVFGGTATGLGASEAERRTSGSWETTAGSSGRMGLGVGLGSDGDGEWGRQGLGKGLEQRLEDLVKEESR